MQDITLYGLKNCDNCRKALKALEDSGKKPVFVDIRADADLAKKLPEWLAAVGAPALVNKRSTTWRTLSVADKAAVEAGDALAALTANPTLIKRPIIEADGSISVGWTKQMAANFA